MRVWLITRNKQMTSFLVFASWRGKFTLLFCLFKWGLMTAITPKRERRQMHYHFTANCPSAFFWCLDCLVHEDFIKEDSFSLSSPTDTVWPGPEINQDPTSIIRQRVSIQWNRRTFCRRSADGFHTGPHHGVVVHDEHPISTNLSVLCSIPDCSYKLRRLDVGNSGMFCCVDHQLLLQAQQDLTPTSHQQRPYFPEKAVRVPASWELKPAQHLL